MNTTRSAALPLALALLALPGFARPFQAAVVVAPTTAQGMFSNAAVGVSVKGVTGADSVLIRSPGHAGGVPTAWSAGTFSAASQVHPDYSMGALINHWAPSMPTVPIFGGISTGSDIMPNVDDLGRLMMAGGNWYMLAVSVDATTVGSSGTILGLQTAGGRNASGDILSYYASGSLGINPAFPNTARLETSRDQLKLAQIPTVPIDPPPAIDNVDIQMGIISDDPQNKAGTMIQTRRCFYYTLTKQYLLATPSLTTLAGQPVNASTVYGMTWSMTPAPPRWSEPFIAFSHDTLFPDLEFPGVTPQNVEIDALTVDLGGELINPETPTRVVFSLTLASNLARPNDPFDQILVHSRGTCISQPLMTSSGVLFSQQIGVSLVANPPTGQPGNVTGLCGIDPPEIHSIYPVVALATDQSRAGAGQLGMSCMRTTTYGLVPDGAESDTLHLQLTGLDYGLNTFGFIQLFTEGPVGSPPKDPVEWGDPIWINPTMRADNSLNLAIPVSNTQAGVDFRFSAHILGLNSPWTTPVFIRESWVLSIEI